jgi:voltage-gated potassium channel
LASWIVQRVGEEDEATQAATAAHIEQLRAEVRSLAELVRDTGGIKQKQVEGDR